ncbi:dTDP-4-dehydrorhamnose reductase [bacterium]|nr:dTDP-4-dehydrorhamnose reductase [bacterium]MCB2179274.1 dTDP-4-dehydrorhamnose reductase [bacterium]
MTPQKKILLFGKNGQLGSRLNHKLQGNNLEAYDYPEVDFNRPDSLAQIIDQIQPALIINAVAYTAVDQAEEQSQMADNINGHSVGVLAEKAKALQAGLIHYSTDYVFDGKKGSLYTEEDTPNPINVYGSSKLLGEEKTIQAGGSYLVFRLSWVYSTTNNSFVTKVLGWSRKLETLKIVDDQISNPTWAEMVACKTLEIINRYEDDWYAAFQPLAGIYHLVGKGAVSRYEWAKAILALDPHKEEQIATQLLPAKSTAFPTPAERPLLSGLEVRKFERTFGLEIPDWHTSLVEAMAEPKTA